MLPGLLVLACFWLAFSNGSTGDWPIDAQPAVVALAHAHFSAYLSAAPIMGPFATLVQAPFSALGGDPIGQYRWACLPCLLAAAALGLYLARCSRWRGASEAFQATLALLCVVNPLTVEALRAGHPEEILTAALAVGAVAAATEDRRLLAAILLGLAVASKQWAVLAIFPTLMALPDQRFRFGAIGVGLVAVLTLPALIASPSSFFEIQGHAASGGRLASIWSAWFPAAPGTVRDLPYGLTATVHELPAALNALTHPLIVACFVLVPLGVWAWRGQFRLAGQEAMALLALLALLRCALDPVDNLYYHAPLLLALLGWDALAPSRLPLRGLAGAALALLFWHWSYHLGDLALFNATYLAVIAAATTATLVWLLQARHPRPLPGGFRQVAEV